MTKKGIVRNSRRLLVKHVHGKNAQKWPVGEDGVARIVRVPNPARPYRREAMHAPHGPGNDRVRPRYVFTQVMPVESTKQAC